MVLVSASSHDQMTPTLTARCLKQRGQETNHDDVDVLKFQVSSYLHRLMLFICSIAGRASRMHRNRQGATLYSIYVKKYLEEKKSKRHAGEWGDNANRSTEKDKKRTMCKPGQREKQQRRGVVRVMPRFH